MVESCDPSWRPIATAPGGAELELSVYDGGEYHALVFPCRRDWAGWRDVRANQIILLRPSHWRWWKSRGAF
jgi:hypothetical protein